MTGRGVPKEFLAAVGPVMRRRGFSRVGRTFRKAVDPPGGLILWWNDVDFPFYGPSHRETSWAMTVHPRLFVETSQVLGEEPKPFERIDPAFSAAMILFHGDPESAPSRQIYDAADPDQVSAVAAALARWAEEAAATGEQWLTDVGAMLDAMDAEAEREPRPPLRWVTDGGGGWIRRPILELAAGRLDDARRSMQKLLEPPDPEEPAYIGAMRTGRRWLEEFPELRSDADAR